MYDIYRFFMRCICRFLVAASATAADEASIIGGAADWQGTAHSHTPDTVTIPQATFTSVAVLA